MIKWKEEYCLGIDTIDAQHKQLIEIANKAYALLKNDLRIDKYDEIVAIIEELKDYTKYHFNSEEEYMKSIFYNKLLSHKVEHDDFIEKISTIDLNAVDEDQDKHLMELLDFVTDWVVSHILKKDKLYAAQ